MEGNDLCSFTRFMKAAMRAALAVTYSLDFPLTRKVSSWENDLWDLVHLYRLFQINNLARFTHNTVDAQRKMRSISIREGL